MLQALLAERFKLAVHRETKELPGYRLVVEKGGSELRRTDASPTGFQVSTEGSLRRLRSTIPVRAIAAFLSDQLRAPVVDQSGIQGTFDVALDWTPDDRRGDDIAAGPSIFTALREQLGLKLESAKVPREILVIEHAEKVPVEN